MTQPKAPYEAGARSPFAGCAILIAAVVMMVFLIGFSVFALFRQAGEIEKFTAVKPVPIEVSPTDNKAAEINDLTARLEKFRADLSGDQESSLALSADDLNLAIAAYDEFKELRGTFRVTKIEGETLSAAISYQLNGRPRFSHNGEPGWIASDFRYLNGTLVARPFLLKKEVVLRLDTIEVPGAAVPQQFIDQMSPYRITERYLADKIIGPAMAKLTRIGVADGKIILTRNPKENPVDMITNEQVDSASSRLFLSLGLAATIFLVFAGIIVIIGLRAKARKGSDT
ncbi:MAG: hypothetical protein ABIT37_08215 [Luteolibacter sp.]